MNGSLILWMTLALSIFWSVGLYNRLMRMRARALGALVSVERHMRHYGELIHEFGVHHDSDAADRESFSMDTTMSGWPQLLIDVQTLDHALKEAIVPILAAEPLERLAGAYGALQRTWLGLHDAPADLAGPMVPVRMQLRWDAITQRVESARGGFNQISTKYNEALGQFPARLVVGTMGFKPGGLL